MFYHVFTTITILTLIAVVITIAIAIIQLYVMRHRSVLCIVGGAIQMTFYIYIYIYIYMYSKLCHQNLYTYPCMCINYIMCRAIYIQAVQETSFNYSSWNGCTNCSRYLTCAIQK